MSLPQITLYQPTTIEISKVAQSAQRRHPECASRIDKAADILAAGLTLEPVAWEKRNVPHWRIASQSNGGAYIVTACGCPCQDSKAPVVARGRRCKHVIAVSLYLKVLSNRFNATVQAREIDLGILPDGTFNAFAPRMGHVHVRKVGSAYVFCDMASAVRFSMWLAAQQPIATEWPVAVAVSA